MPPTGEIVARPMLVRACGCTQEFQYYAVDKYRVQRQAKFQKTRCPACVAKLVEEQRKLASVPKKGEAFKLLPPGTQVTLNRKPDGSWVGVLAGEGITVEATGDGEGPQSLIVALTRRWLAARNPPTAKPAAKPAAAAAPKPAAAAAPKPAASAAAAAKPKPKPG